MCKWQIELHGELTHQLPVSHYGPGWLSDGFLRILYKQGVNNVMADRWGGTIHKWFAEKMCVCAFLRHGRSPSHNKGVLPIRSICRAPAFSCLNIPAPLLGCKFIYHSRQGRGGKSIWTDEKLISPPPNDSSSTEINDKFVLCTSLQDILILQHFTFDIYVCRSRLHYHRGCLIILSVRRQPSCRWLTALDL